MRASFGAALLAVAALAASAAAADSAPLERLPRMASGKPDLSGVWQALSSANWNIEAHAAYAGTVASLGAQGAVPPGLGVVEGGKIPYLPAAEAQRNENFKNRGTADPELKCYRPGVPRATYMPQPFQIVESDSDILVVYQYAGASRTIYMNDAREAPVDSWMGWSNGHWEGDTLVVEVTGQNGMTWLDRAGNFGSENMRVVERYTPLGPNHLEYEATIEDPTVYSRPWKIRMPLYRRIEPDARLLEFKCPEFAEELLYGELRKRSSAEGQENAEH
ncbi:MAG TPA: hypothetical protein VFV10_16135 [Gammaproteobacteria bacterium]|nr:hypothetical protein [Gammaproteobacteria bacterium]